MTGTLYGVGLGPGDPDLITLRAARLIREAEVIAYPEPLDGSSFARSIAESLFAEDVIEIPVSVPMQEERFPAQEVYRTAASEIKEHLDAGTDVIVLCQGDPFFYGSFMYLFVRLAEGYRAEVVPGVSSLSACSAAAQQPLCARMESLTVLPAPMAEDNLRRRLDGGGAAAVVKLGRHMPKVRRALSSLGLMEKAVYIAHATLPLETVLPLEDAPEDAPYFSMILVPGRDPYGAR